MARNFYSGTEAELATGSTHAVSIITPEPADYGLTSAIVASYTVLAASFNDLLTIATAPETRSPVNIAKKNDAKRLLKAASVNLSRTIAATATVSNAQLLGLNMNLRVSPTPRTVPATPPTITVLSVVGRVVTLRVTDATSKGRGMPFGAQSANIFSYVGPDAPTDPAAYQFLGATTRAKARLLFPNSAPSGATVWLSAAWVSRRGEAGVAGAPKNFTLQGGPVVAASA